MPDFKAVGKFALGTAAGAAVGVLIVFGIICRASAPALLAALGLVTIGGAVTGALIRTSLEEPDEEHG